MPRLGDVSVLMQIRAVGRALECDIGRDHPMRYGEFRSADDEGEIKEGLRAALATLEGLRDRGEL